MNQQILELTDEIIKAQDSIPNSPCEVDEKGIRFCAAAALASAGLKHYCGTDVLAFFESQLSKKRDSQLVREAFSKLGWDVRHCDIIMKYNDSLPQENRKKSILKFIKDLKE